jgi:hypothetical protein
MSRTPDQTPKENLHLTRRARILMATGALVASVVAVSQLSEGIGEHNGESAASAEARILNGQAAPVTDVNIGPGAELLSAPTIDNPDGANDATATANVITTLGKNQVLRSQYGWKINTGNQDEGNNTMYVAVPYGNDKFAYINVSSNPLNATADHGETVLDAPSTSPLKIGQGLEGLTIDTDSGPIPMPPAEVITN